MCCTTRAGLHNRVTRTIPLKPFNLHETESFLRGREIPLEQDQILELFMAVGGIPYYLDYARKGKSAAQNIDALSFAPNAPLRDEFDQLYAALFTHHDQHVKVIRELARKRSGLTRQQLRKHGVFSRVFNNTYRTEHPRCCSEESPRMSPGV
jgi:uncharacterized protein